MNNANELSMNRQVVGQASRLPVGQASGLPRGLLARKSPGSWSQCIRKSQRRLPTAAPSGTLTVAGGTVPSATSVTVSGSATGTPTLYRDSTSALTKVEKAHQKV